MSDLLLELFSEEIPARMQTRASADLQKLVTDQLVAQGFLYEGARTFVTPRRLTLAVHGLPVRGQDVREEKKGPRVGAPDQAIQGFLKSAGLESIDQATIITDAKKGDSYVAIIERPGRATVDVLAEIIPGIVKAFPWPKSMRWGKESASGASFRWVRPLRSILCTFGDETEEPEVVRFEVGGIISSDVTFGHRFMSDGQPIKVKRLEDYMAKLEAAKVMLDPERRKHLIRHEAEQLCFAQGLELVEDEGLLEEVAGLVEWPVPLMGSFEEEFLSVPQEAVRLTIRANQKCFVVRRPSPSPLGEGGMQSMTDEGESQALVVHPHPTASSGHPLPREREKGELANRFIATANVEASDGGKLIIAGNGRVIRARLSDARYFWETDQKVTLETRAGKLKTTRFHEKLGTQYERVERIAALAKELAPLVGADPALAHKAAMLAKADLATEMVGEFPELQGLMGRYYAQLEGHEPEVCAAIEEHYKPQGPGDSVPTNPVSVAVALADKLDTLVGFWAIDEKPTGSKDPYALRRAALGVIRLVVENGAKLKLNITFNHAFKRTLLARANYVHIFQSLMEIGKYFAPAVRKDLDGDFYIPTPYSRFVRLGTFPIGRLPIDATLSVPRIENPNIIEWGEAEAQCRTSFLSFFHDRLKVMLREQGARHDLVDAVLGAGANAHPSPLRGGSERSEGEGGSNAGAQPPLPSAAQPPSPQGGGMSSSNDDLLSIVTRVNALSAFLATDDGVNLLAGTKRATNILRAEEKKDGDGAFEGEVNATILKELPEHDLYEVLRAEGAAVEEAITHEDYAAAMAAMARLRAPVDTFFEAIFVNDPDPALRLNRLRLLATLRRVTSTVADFSKVAG